MRGSTEQLEEVFQAAEQNYSLLQQGKQSLNYSFNYSYSGDQRLDLEVINGQVRNLDVTPSATHNFTNSFSYDYGFKDNLTIGTRIPLVSKFDTQEELNVNGVGDISVTTRWQPNPHVPGTMSTTLFSTLSTKTGVSPFEIDTNRQLSTGSGYYSIGGGASVSRFWTRLCSSVRGACATTIPSMISTRFEVPACSKRLSPVSPSPVPEAFPIRCPMTFPSACRYS